MEASATVQRLASRGIAARLLRISGLTRGSALAERARAARMQMLTAACAEAGILHLLLGHHAADQAETVLIRELGGSGPIGLAGMAPLVETPTVRILRPLLAMPPGELRQSLVEAGMRWVEDPSNADRSALRPRLRWLRRDPGGAGPATSALAQSAAALGRGRASHEASVAAELAEHVSLRPEGFAHVDAWPLSAGALAALVQTVAGTPFPPAAAGIAKLSGALLGWHAGWRAADAGGSDGARLAADARSRCHDSRGPGLAGCGMGRAVPARRRDRAASRHRRSGLSATTRRYYGECPSCLPPSCAPCRRSGWRGRFSQCRISPILIARPAQGFRCYSALDGRPHPPTARLGMHDGSRHPMLSERHARRSCYLCVRRTWSDGGVRSRPYRVDMSEVK